MTTLSNLYRDLCKQRVLLGKTPPQGMPGLPNNLEELDDLIEKLHALDGDMDSETLVHLLAVFNPTQRSDQVLVNLVEDAFTARGITLTEENMPDESLDHLVETLKTFLQPMSTTYTTLWECIDGALGLMAASTMSNALRQIAPGRHGNTYGSDEDIEKAETERDFWLKWETTWQKAKLSDR